MKWLHWISGFSIVVCMQAPQTMATDHVDSDAKKFSARGSLSPSAPVNLTYRFDGKAIGGQAVKINLEITTRLVSGALLVEVAKQEGAVAIGETTQRIDLATVAHPIAQQLQATL